MSSTIHIVNYGMGNLHSIQKKLRRLNVGSVISSDASEIRRADKIILPGVGHFQMAMDNVKRLGLLDILNEVVLIRKRPILGICLGMQLMANWSEEGSSDGFGWIDAKVVRFRMSNPQLYKVPHVGWNNIVKNKDSRLLMNINEDEEFYFVHSYHVVAANKSDVLCETDYESRFVSAIEHENIFGVQFHPEKSHDQGSILMKNFIQL